MAAPPLVALVALFWVLATIGGLRLWQDGEDLPRWVAVAYTVAYAVSSVAVVVERRENAHHPTAGAAGPSASRSPASTRR